MQEPDHKNQEDYEFWSDKTFKQKRWTQTNQATIDTFIKTVHSLFLLNGAAATALLAQPELGVKWAAISFALGSFVAIFTIGSSYIFNSTALQRIPLDHNENKLDDLTLVTGLPDWTKIGRLSNKGLKTLRAIVIGSAIFSGLLFLVGLVMVASCWRA